MSEPARSYEPVDGKSPHYDPVQGKIVHEYDGIQEADNMLPRWWLGIFYGSIVFAFGYWIVYESWSILPYQSEIHAQEVLAAAESGAVDVDDALLEMLAQNEEAVARGNENYQANCVACHGDRGQGIIGPNLTDAMWKHGGAPVDIYRIIRDGFQERGMPPWGAALGERQVQAVTAFVLTLRDTNVPGREPEGELWVPGAAAGDAENEGGAEGESEDAEGAEVEVTAPANDDAAEAREAPAEALDPGETPSEEASGGETDGSGAQPAVAEPPERAT